LLREARAGESGDALHYGGLLHLYGKGVRQSPAEAAEYFRRAAEGGHASSQTALAVLLRHGVGLRRDDAASFAWLTRAAEALDVDAMWLLGVAHMERNSTEIAEVWLTRAAAPQHHSPDAMHWLGVLEEYRGNATEALRRYSEAAALGQTESVFNLGLLRAYGRGCHQDLPRAATLFQRAASHGHAGAMYYLAIFNLYGHAGFDVNYRAARTWFQRAEATNNAAFAPKAAEARRELEHSLAMATTATHDMLDSLLIENDRRHNVAVDEQEER